MSAKRKVLGLVTMFLLLIVGGFVVYLISQTNLSVDDSGALYGGKPEYGYPYAGFLINQTVAGGTKTCGYAAISDRMALTASHCVDDAKNIFLGVGQFQYDTNGLVQVDQALQKEAWVNSKNRPDDFAILSFRDSRNLYPEYAEIASPIEGCFYRVVAYGRTENPDEGATKPRKSARLCGSEITTQTFKVVGSDSGICFGDSGSPVFLDGTNKIVGVIVSIVNKVPNDPNPCDFGNTAIVVRTDYNQKLINETQDRFSPLAPDIQVVDGLTIDVADQTIFEKLGLNFVEQIPERQRYLYLLYGMLLFIVVLILITLYMIYKPKRKRDGEMSMEEYNKQFGVAS